MESPPLVLKETFPLHPTAVPGLMLADFKENLEIEGKGGGIEHPAVLLPSIAE